MNEGTVDPISILKTRLAFGLIGTEEYDRLAAKLTSGAAREEGRGINATAQQETTQVDGPGGPIEDKLTAEQHESLRKTQIWLIKASQETHSPFYGSGFWPFSKLRFWPFNRSGLWRHFNSPAVSLRMFQWNGLGFFWCTISILALCLTASLAISWFAIGAAGNTGAEAMWDDWQQRTAPVALAAFLAFLTAMIYTHWREQRNVAFKLIEELLGKDFEETRYKVVQLANQCCAAGKDLDDLEGWFPLAGRSTPMHLPYPPSSDIFSHEHALSRLLYFVYRIHLYQRHGMLQQAVTRHMFHGFFAHYEILLLECATAYRRKAHGQIYDERWLMLADGIERFCKLIGLAGVLPPSHRYVYFPSLNKA